MFNRFRLFLLSGSGIFLFLSMFPSGAFGAFGLTSSSTSYTVDTGAGLVFKVRRTDTGSSTQSAGDLMSLVYQGVEYQNQSRGSQLNSGFDFLYPGITAVNVAAAVVNVDFIKITVTSGDLTHYYLARKGYPHIYMATHFTSQPDAAGGLCRYIVRIPSGLLPNGPAPSDIRNTTTTIESGDIFGVPDGTTRSKHYSNQRLIDWSYIGATGPNVGVWMMRSNHEGDSGGPFYRSLLNQCGTDQEITYILNYGQAQTEPFRFNILNGPYTLIFTNGAAPATPDTSWFGTMGLTGYVAPGDRGSVAGTAILNRDTRYSYTVALANPAAQYWATAASGDGAFSVPGVLPGTYTLRIFKNELAVHTRTVTVNAGSVTTLGSVPIASGGTNGDPSHVIPLWRIGNWDGSPREFLNGDKLTIMHPSDTRMAPWAPGPYTIGISTPALGFPAYHWKEIQPTQVVKFELTEAQRVASTIRVGITIAYEGARPKIAVNNWNSTNPASSSQPDSRSLTTGSYRGNNTTFTFAVPASAFVAGTNTLYITPISGSGASGFLSAGYSYDCVEMYQGTEKTAAVPVPPMPFSATGGNGLVTVRWPAGPEGTTYALQRSLSAAGPFETLAADLTTASYLDSGLRNGTTYYYIINGSNVSGTGVFSNPISAVPTGPESLVHLKLDESSGSVAADATGNGWEGTLVNGPAWSAGRLNNGVNLDGLNDYITLPDGLLANLGNFTISAWVKLDVVNAWSRLFDFGKGSGTYCFLTARNGATNTVRFAITAAGIAGEQKIDGTAALPANVWTHVAVSLNGTTGTLYVNGVASGTNPAMTVSPYDLGITTRNYLGRSQFLADPYLDGTIDEFRVYGRALTGAEVSLLATPPNAPTGLSAVAADSSISLSWNAVAGATSYAIRRAPVGGTFFLLSATGTDASFRDSQVVNGTTYSYLITAANDMGDGGTSAPVFAKPSGPFVAQELQHPLLLRTSPTSASLTQQVSVVGHLYQLQYRDDFLSGAWQPFGSAVQGNGGTIVLPAPVESAAPRRFYRVEVQR